MVKLSCRNVDIFGKNYDAFFYSDPSAYKMRLAKNYNIGLTVGLGLHFRIMLKFLSW